MRDEHGTLHGKVGACRNRLYGCVSHLKERKGRNKWERELGTITNHPASNVGALHVSLILRVMDCVVLR